MKRILLSSFIVILSVVCTIAQVPQAFKYQAVVRDKGGNIIADQQISLRVSILLNDTEGILVYMESHRVATNGFGLITLEIGRGENASGSLSDINWAAGNYFIKIEMDESGGNAYQVMGTSQLLSVPFALHSGTTMGLADPFNGERGGGGVPSNVWSLFGNSDSDPVEDKLGTTDATDMVVVTDDMERMRIKSDGDIDISRSLKVGKNLNVEQNVNLNTVSGQTINYGPFTVANLSPTLLSGTLTVDQATDLNSSLNVDGVTDLNSAFHVNNASPSILTGTLLVNGDATFNQHVLLDNASLGSTSPSSGALVVNGGVGIGENLNVGGDATFDGHVTIKGPLALTDTSSSYDESTGALTVAGGVGIAKQLNVGGAATLNNTLAANGQVTITANPGSGTEGAFGSYPLRVQGSSQGISIKVNGSRGNANNYISFWDESSGGAMWGRIEGETSGELASNPEFIVQNTIFGIDAAIGVANTVMAGIEIAGASTSSTACVGFGACVTTPVPSLIVSAVAKAVIEAASLVLTLGEAAAYNSFAFSNIGVTYQSGAGDYAEWLKKENPGETFFPGEIVGVKGGLISRTTQGADKVLVISYNPIILGNMPEAGNEKAYEKVAFMGQVPVKVMGDVQPGDYIIPSGKNNGFGIAVHPDELKSENFGNIVGTAWTASGENEINFVNVVVGMTSNDIGGLVAKQEERIQKQEEEIQALQAQINKMNTALASLLPGYDIRPGASGITNESSIPLEQEPSPQSTSPVSDEGTVVYYQVADQEIIDGYELAEKMLKDKGVDLSDHPFFQQMNNDPTYKEKFISELKMSVEKAVKEQNIIDTRHGSVTERR